MLQIPGDELRRHFGLDVRQPITYSPSGSVASVVPLPDEPDAYYNPDATSVGILFRVPPEGFGGRLVISGDLEYVRFPYVFSTHIHNHSLSFVFRS